MKNSTLKLGKTIVFGENFSNNNGRRKRRNTTALPFQIKTNQLMMKEDKD